MPDIYVTVLIYAILNHGRNICGAFGSLFLREFGPLEWRLFIGHYFTSALGTNTCATIPPKMAALVSCAYSTS